MTTLIRKDRKSLFSAPFQDKIERALASADIRIDGSRPWDIQVNDPRLFRRVALHGMLGAGEAYMDGWWECGQLDEMVARAYSSEVNRELMPLRDYLYNLHAHVRNLQSRLRAFQVGQHHYDIGQDLYRAMLDRRMIYSCAYWKRAETLDQAQEHKLDLIARKLQFEPGMRVLDIGCGWGGALRYLSERYGITGVGVTISTDQYETAVRESEGLPIEFWLRDYRELAGDAGQPFDRIFSIGMFEHVGYKNYRRFMRIVSRCLRPDGLFLLHTIGGKRSEPRTDPWIDRYIFPNGVLPSAARITAAAEAIFSIEDWHNFPYDYWRTLKCWYRNFADAWSELHGQYDERFFRMWRYYLLTTAGSFRAGGNQLWQIVFSPRGVAGGYTPDNIR